MNCTNLQQFITTYPRKNKLNTIKMYWHEITRYSFSSWVSSDFFVYFLVLYVNRRKKKGKKNRKEWTGKKKRKKKTKKRKKKKQRIRLQSQIMETNNFTRTTLVLANTPITNGFTYEKALSMLKDEIQKSNTSEKQKGNKTPQHRNYWHFPCVMLCTLPFVVQLQYILQYVKHLKCESGNNSTNRWQYWQQQQRNCCSLPVSYLNMHNVSIRVIYWMSEAWVWQYIPGETPRVSKKCRTTSTFSAFMCYFTSDYSKHSHNNFCNLRAHKLNGCHWNS